MALTGSEFRGDAQRGIPHAPRENPTPDDDATSAQLDRDAKERGRALVAASALLNDDVSPGEYIGPIGFGSQWKCRDEVPEGANIEELEPTAHY